MFATFLPLFFLPFPISLDGFEGCITCGSSGSSAVLVSGVGTIGFCGTGVLLALRNVIRLVGGVLETFSSTVSADSAPDPSNSGDLERVTFSDEPSEICSNMNQK